MVGNLRDDHANYVSVFAIFVIFGNVPHCTLGLAYQMQTNYFNNKLYKTVQYKIKPYNLK